MQQNMVYAYGIITPSSLLMIQGNFPKPDHYAEVNQIYKMTGGEACNSSIVLAKLGVSVSLDGLWLGDNVKALELLDFLQKNKINTEFIHVKKGFQNVEETVIADKQNLITIKEINNKFEKSKKKATYLHISFGVTLFFAVVSVVNVVKPVFIRHR